jgi:hypothetical protein
VKRVDSDRIVWIEAPLAIADAAWPPGVGLDVTLADPAREAASLYGVAQLRADRPLRVTIPVVEGVGRAARIAMALQLPVRLLPRQPPPDAIGELHAVLEAYLHDPQTTASVQPFDSALAFWLHGHPATVWAALDLDPAFVRTVRDGGDGDGAGAPPDGPGFVATTAARLVAGGAECAACPFLAWCAGFFKWPDPAYACDAVKPLLGAIAGAAAQIARDLDEAQAMQP